MKKKILLFSLLVAILVCAFAICVSAEDNIIKLDKLPTLDEIHANREAYVSYVEALEDETTYKAKDPDSVIVLSDLAVTPTYYVYPAYYLIRSTYYNIAANLSKFNDAILASDPTAFAGYTATGGTWGNGDCDYVIRLEFPKYVTQIAGQYKFEGSANIKEIYFPVYTTIDEETGLEKTVPYCATISGQNLFGNCPKLEVMHNQRYLPKELFQGNNAGFSGCSSLKEIYIPEGVTSLTQGFFHNCSSLKEIILPNSLVSVGKAAFSGCTSLETFSFGAGFTTLSRVNADYETFYDCDGLKYVYMPVGFLTAVENASAGDYKHIFNGIDSNVTFFFTGTEAEAVRIKELMALTNNNPTLGNAKIEAYNPNTNYTDYGTTVGSNVIVWGYYVCDAFYNGAHQMKETEYRFAGTEYFSEFHSYTGCDNCAYVEDVMISDALFTKKGITVPENEKTTSICHAITVNPNAIDAYNAYLGESNAIKYGVVVGKATEFGTPVNAQGTSSENAIVVGFEGTAYSHIQSKITNVPEDTGLYCSAYVIDAGVVTYLYEGSASTTAQVISLSNYNPTLPEATVPSNDEE